MRLELRTYDKKGDKKALEKLPFETPMEARQSEAAKEAEYYEIYDNLEKRVIEIKIELGA